MPSSYLSIFAYLTSVSVTDLDIKPFGWPSWKKHAIAPLIKGVNLDYYQILMVEIGL